MWCLGVLCVPQGERVVGRAATRGLDCPARPSCLDWLHSTPRMQARHAVPSDIATFRPVDFGIAHRGWCSCMSPDKPTEQGMADAKVPLRISFFDPLVRPSLSASLSCLGRLYLVPNLGASVRRSAREGAGWGPQPGISGTGGHRASDPSTEVQAMGKERGEGVIFQGPPGTVADPLPAAHHVDRGLHHVARGACGLLGCHREYGTPGIRRASREESHSPRR